MHESPRSTESPWTGVAIPPNEPLTHDIRTNVCVVGSGIAGLSVAYMLTRAGKAVTVIDDGPIGAGETGRTTAHLSAILDERYTKLASRHGTDAAKRVAQSHINAIDRIESIANLEDIDCDFERVEGFLVLKPNEKHAVLKKELDTLRELGVMGVSIVPRIPSFEFDTGPALRIERQAQFHPLKYLSGLAHAIVRDGGTITSDAKATQIEDVDPEGAPARVVTTSGYTITADDIVVATNSPVNDWMVMHTKQAAYRTYVTAFRIPRGAVPRVLLWDTEDPYHYVRVHPSSTDPKSDLLIVGGEDHKTGQADHTNNRFEQLELWARERFSAARERLYQWSGQVLETVDGLAYIGRNPGNQHIYVATGASGNGMTYGTIAGIRITDLILGRSSTSTEIYDPSRISIRAAGEYARENINVAEQYARWLTPGDVRDLDEIPNGTGAVIRRGIHKIAVYKDLDGTISERSATCTHLRCIVDWNDTEKTWDCPCHGSRFDAYGTVIAGPAISDLEPAPETRESERTR